jgi:hypothetical protein
MERSRILSAAISWDRENGEGNIAGRTLSFCSWSQHRVWIVSIAITILFFFLVFDTLGCHGFGKDGGDTPIPYSDVSGLLKGQMLLLTDQQNYL